MMTALVLSGEMARELTERIRVATTELAKLLAEAHDGEAWRALGYSSWSAYIDGEFDFKRAHSYRLLHQAKAIEVLSAAAGEPVAVSESAARSIAGRLPETAERVASAVGAGAEPSEAVKRALEEQRNGGWKPKPAAPPPVAPERPPSAAYERLVAGQHAQPLPKPASNGAQSPVARWRQWASELEAIAEQLTPEGGAGLDDDTERVLRRLHEASGRVLGL
jgi:hypothetical protein